jgi:hypothetical protein
MRKKRDWYLFAVLLKTILYIKATLRYFITHLLNEQVHVGISWTRSRNRETVKPQMGILKYIMEANQDAERNEIRSGFNRVWLLM